MGSAHGFIRVGYKFENQGAREQILRPYYDQNHMQIPQTDQLAIQIGQTMKSDGFQFTGPVVSYSFLQAIGIINDHEVACFRCKELNNCLKSK